MKKMKLGVLACLLVALCIGLASCIWPDALPEDTDQREVAPTALFSYYPPEYPVQTGSRVAFDGRDSYDTDGEIIWGEWDFGDGTIPVEGVWTKVVQRLENGVEVFETVSVMREENHTFNDLPESGSYYTVTLTVWDDDDNKSATSRQIKIDEQLDL